MAYCLMTMDPSLKRDSIENFFKIVDFNQDGIISYEDFY